MVPKTKIIVKILVDFVSYNIRTSPLNRRDEESSSQPFLLIKKNE